MKPANNAVIWLNKFQLLLKLFHDVADLSALKEDNIRFTFEHCDVLILCKCDWHSRKSETYFGCYCFETSDEVWTNIQVRRLQQVLINLLINATKFTQEGRIVLKAWYRWRTSGSYIRYWDTGCGIPLKSSHIYSNVWKIARRYRVPVSFLFVSWLLKI